jgi:hypothetical protein
MLDRSAPGAAAVGVGAGFAHIGDHEVDFSQAKTNLNLTTTTVDLTKTSSPFLHNIGLRKGEL